MKEPSVIPELAPSRFERFGLYYLGRFKRGERSQDPFSMSDVDLARHVRRLTWWGIGLSSLIGLVCVHPIILADIKLTGAPPLVYFGVLAAVTVVATAVEFYFLFLVSLRAVHRVSEIIHMEHLGHESMRDGIFSVRNILARTALELPDPELRILGIDPFRHISRKNLLLIGLLYKGKIIVTNLLLKTVLRHTLGAQVFGWSVLWIAIPVEIFWNSVVIHRVIREARLRLFGYALANRIADDAEAAGYIRELSPLARSGCLRAIGNAVVMTQNYHPNMVILLLRFRNLLGIAEDDRLDDWGLFLKTLDEVPEHERYFLLDLLTVAAAFDGRLSGIERSRLGEAYREDHLIYQERLFELTRHLRHGRLNAALLLCGLDYVKG